AFGYQSGLDLLDDLRRDPDLKADIEAATDERMAAEHPELFSEQALVERSIEVTSGEAMQKVVAAMLRSLDPKKLENRRVLLAVAKSRAQQIIGSMELHRVRPADYSKAAGRARRDMVKAQREGDLSAMKSALRREIQQHALATEAARVLQTARQLKRVAKKRYSKHGKALAGRNEALVRSAQLVLSRLGFMDPPRALEANPEWSPWDSSDLDPESIEGYKAMLSEELKLADAYAAEAKQTQFKRKTDTALDVMPVDEFLSLMDTLDGWWQMAKRETEITVGNRTVKLEAVLAEMAATRGERTPLKEHGAKTSWEKAKSWLWSQAAQFVRMEHFARKLDKGDDGGIFQRVLVREPRRAAAKLRLRERQVLEQLKDLLTGFDLGDMHQIRAEGLVVDKDGNATDYVFGRNSKIAGKLELVHAILNMGNKSNERVLVLGHEWGTETDGVLDSSRWRAFVQEQIDAGVITEADLKRIQQIWDLTESLVPDFQKTHVAVFGHEVRLQTKEEVNFLVPDGATGTGRKQVTLKGGYVPLTFDEDQNLPRNLKSLEDMLKSQAFLPAVNRSFTKDRTGATYKLALNPLRLGEHVHSVLTMTYMAPIVRDLNRLTRDQRFKEIIGDSVFLKDIVDPYVNVVASQRIAPEGNDPTKWLNNVTSRVGMTIMFGNVKNTLQNVTTLPTVAARVGWGNVRRAAVLLAKQDNQFTGEWVMTESEFMRDRFQSHGIWETRDDMEAFARSLNASGLGKLQSFFDRHGYFLQKLTQEPTDLITWIAGYNHALVELGSDIDPDTAHREAVERADALVSQTQSSMSPQDTAPIQRGSGLFRMWTQFSGWSINFLNNSVTEVVVNGAKGKTATEIAGKMMASYMMATFMPIILAEAIAVLSDGRDLDEDEDGGVWDDLAWRTLTSQINTLASGAPIWGTAGQMVFNTLVDPRGWDAQLKEPPLISMFRRSLMTVRTGDVASLRGLHTTLGGLGAAIGIPLQKLAGPIIAIAEMIAGNADTEGNTPLGAAFEIPRAVITGRVQRER
ncbi:MAG: hypothetical protein HRT82_17475, partial [Henriciella sp.]|nr:hypothetical protein [Henriciella sp.]